MTAPSSPVEVCNLSLDLLRHNSLMTTLDTPPLSEEEALGARWYDPTRRSVLRAFPWNFARARISIPRLSSAPAFGYDDAYALPNNYIGLVFIGVDEREYFNTPYTIEGRNILLDNNGAASLQICYIQDVEDVTKFDPIFLNLLVGELAVVFGNAITGLNKSIKGMENFRDRWEAKARAKNGQENPPKVHYSSPLLNARRTGRRSTTSDGTHLFS